MPENAFSICLSQELDSVKSRFHRILRSLNLRIFGKSIGPKTVVETTIIKGKDKIYKRLKTIPESDSKAVWFPEPSLDLWSSQLRNRFDRSSVLLGPSIDIFNPLVIDNLKLLQFAKILVPSQWVLQLYSTHFGLSIDRIFVWAAGIDHDFWNPGRRKGQTHVLLYLKTTISQEELSAISNFASTLNMKLKIVRYGKYSKKYYRRMLVGAKFLIWAGDTESQGLAQFEAWSMDVPSLVRKSNTFLQTDLGSASPYISEFTGLVTKTSKITPYDLQLLLERSNSFSPREWIIQNANPKLARIKLLEIANKN